MGEFLQSLLGMAAIPALAWALSEDRRAIGLMPGLRLVAVALAMQAAIAALLLGVPQSRYLFDALAAAVRAVQSATLEGMQFVFGYLAGGPPPFTAMEPKHGFILAFQALPMILFMCVLSRLLYHWGILQRVVAAFAWALRRSFGIGGPLGTATAANIFVGMVDAPLLIRPYLAGMSRADLFATMTAGMATVAGTVMALYASLLDSVLPGAAGHILAASVMSAPAALMVARLMVPGTEDVSPGAVEMAVEDETVTVMDAVAQATVDGLRLLAYVTAMLVVMVSLVALANSILAGIGGMAGVKVTVQQVFGWLFAPLAWLIGIPWSEAGAAGALFGIKTVLNELLAYV
ncbi:MAG: nucleoside transporter C-terminal domain-containing protein, partial [Pseudomonadota bacterium]|nr:nucleoside transporter C-terminal domain-containing protein [Pseudomonadota bacterium]